MVISVEQMKENLTEFYSKNDSNDHTTKFRIRRQHFVQLAGVIGALAVALGAYGAHVLGPDQEISEERKIIFITGNFYHFIHALALLGVPLTNKPTVVGMFFLVGISLFCGTCYITGISGNTMVSRFTPYGGIALIVGWLCMVL